MMCSSVLGVGFFIPLKSQRGYLMNQCAEEKSSRYYLTGLFLERNEREIEPIMILDIN